MSSWLTCVFALALFLTVACAAGGPLELKAGRFTLRFSADGRRLARLRRAGSKAEAPEAKKRPLSRREGGLVASK